MNNLFEAIKNSTRLSWVKTEWKNGNHWKAISVFNNSLPNLTYPLGPEVMDQLFDQYGYWKFTGPMAGVTWWREVWHFIGGLCITLPFIFWPTLSFAVSVIIAMGKAASEFYLDARGSPDLKNFADWLFWILGSATVTICSFLIFGTDTYK
jgi:hypothetical protein